MARIRSVYFLGLFFLTPALFAAEVLPSFELSAHESDILCADFSKTGDLATVSNWEPAVVKIWDVEQRQLKQEFAFTNNEGSGATQVMYSAPEHNQVAVMFNGDPIICDIRSGQLITKINLGARSNDMVYHPTESLLACDDTQGNIGVWDTQRNCLSKTLQINCGHVRAIDYSHDGSILAGFSTDKTTDETLEQRVWKYNNGTNNLESCCRAPDRLFSPLKFSPHDSSSVGIGSSEKIASLMNVFTGYITDLVGHKNMVGALAFNHQDSTMVATGSHDKTVKIWNINGAGKYSLRTPGEVSTVAFHPSGRMLVAACYATVDVNKLCAKIKGWDISKALPQQD